jgi:cysteine desulfurase
VSVVQADYERAAERCARLIHGIRAIDGGRTIPFDRAEADPRFSPYIVQAAFRGVPGEALARALDDAGFAVSTGSACSSSSRERPVLAAMGVDKATSLEGIRVSQGWSTSMDDIDRLLVAIGQVVARL